MKALDREAREQWIRSRAAGPSCSRWHAGMSGIPSRTAHDHSRRSGRHDPEPEHGRRARSRRRADAPGHRPGGTRDRHPARGLGAGHGRVPDRGVGPGADRDGQPVVGARCCWPRWTRSGSGPRSWPGWRSPTSTSTTPAAWVTWRGPSPRPPCTSTRRGRATWPTRPGSSTRPRGSTARCSTRSTAGSIRPRPSGSTCWPTGRRSWSARTGPWWRWTHPGTPSTTWASTTRRAASSSPATPSG